MRHRKKLIRLGRKTAHRKSMLANIGCSLITHKRINTTLTKARALQRFIDPIINRSKTDDTANRRLAFKYLRSKHAVTELFDNLSRKIADRSGGFTRIVKLGNRLGDNASMVMIEFVDYNDVYKLDKTVKKRTRRGGGKKKTLDSLTSNNASQASAGDVEQKSAENSDD